MHENFSLNMFSHSYHPYLRCFLYIPSVFDLFIISDYFVLRCLCLFVLCWILFVLLNSVIAVSSSSPSFHYPIQTSTKCLIFFLCNSCTSSHHIYLTFFGVLATTNLHMCESLHICEGSRINPFCSFKWDVGWILFGFVPFHSFRI